MTINTVNDPYAGDN
jgi:hypothetical protein